MSQLVWLEGKHTLYKQHIVHWWTSWWCRCCWWWWWWWRWGRYCWCPLRKAGWRVGVQIDAGFQFDLLLPNQIICDIVALVIMVMIWWPLPKQCHCDSFYFPPQCSWDAGLFQDRPHICPFFSPQTYFWAQFFSTWKRVNCGKISEKFSKFSIIFQNFSKISQIFPKFLHMKIFSPQI